MEFNVKEAKFDSLLGLFKYQKNLSNLFLFLSILVTVRLLLFITYEEHTFLFLFFIFH